MAENTETTTNTTTTTKRNNPVRQNFIAECRNTRIIVETRLSPNMRRIYRRNFDPLSRSVYLTRFYARVSRLTDVEEAVTKEMSNLMTEVNENLRKKITVAEQILHANGIKETEQNFDKFNVTIIDPLANRFLQTIKIAQELDEKLSALWLGCVLDDGQRRKALTEIESDLRTVSNKFRALSLGLRNRVRSQQATVNDSDKPDVSVAQVGIDLKEDLSEAVKNSEEPTATKKTRKTAKEPKALDDTEELGLPEIGNNSEVDEKIEDIAA